MDVNCTPNTPYTKPTVVKKTPTADQWYLTLNKDQKLARGGKTETSFIIVPCTKVSTSLTLQDECKDGTVCAKWTYGDATSEMMCTTKDDCTKAYTNAKGKIDIKCTKAVAKAGGGGKDKAAKDAKDSAAAKAATDAAAAAKAAETNAKALITSTSAFLAGISYLL